MLVAVTAVVVAAAPQTVPDPAGAMIPPSFSAPLTQVSQGWAHGCGLTTTNEAVCWGDNHYGQLGTGTTTDSPRPVKVKTAGTPLAGKTVVQVEVGTNLSCAVTSDGNAACWGQDSWGALGAGGPGDSTVPVAVTKTGTPMAGKSVTAISVGSASTVCAVASGAAFCWGYNDSTLGIPGAGITSVPAAVTTTGTALAGKTVIDISVGGYHTCALVSVGGPVCWGYNQFGESGVGTTTGNLPTATAVVTAGTPLAGTTVTQISSGDFHTCARTANGKAVCWGQNFDGRVGDGSKTDRLVPTAVSTAGVLAGKSITSVAAGGNSSCATASDGSAACWGNGATAQLGNGGLTSSTVPVLVTRTGTALSGRSVSRISLGGAATDNQASQLSYGYSACAVTSDGTGACWGIRRNGEHGSGHADEYQTPIGLNAPGALSGRTISALHLGSNFTCSRTSDGQVVCWGKDTSGEMGNGPAPGGATPTLVTKAATPLSGRSVAQIAGTTSATCALATDNTIACWGNNYFGDIGNGGATNAVTPTAVTRAGTALASRTVDAISGYGHMCAHTTDGNAACWGLNLAGEIGTGAATGFEPIRVPTLVAKTGALSGKSISQVVAGGQHTCALTADNVIACWGSDAFGQMGNGPANDGGNALTPVAVTRTGTPLAGKTITKLWLGYVSTCAQATDGTTACWGGAPFNSNVPAAIPTAGTPLAGKTITEMSFGTVGNERVCARAGTTASCWGENGTGAVGDGTDVASTVPTALVTAGTPLQGKAIALIRTGGDHSCAVATDGTVGCWGNAIYGDLGAYGTEGAAATTPVKILGTGPVPTAPPAPTGVSGVPGNGRVTLSWTQPADGGSPITGYVVTPYIGAVAQPARNLTGTATTRDITGLTNGTAYTFRVAAVNALGTGAQSAASSPITPAIPPYDPFASWSAFVTRQYQDLTAKAPTASELSTWVTNLGNGSKTKGDLIEALRRGTDNSTNVDPTARLYRAFLGRAPDAAGLEFWVERRRTGGWSLVRMADYFANSAEFKAKYGTLTNRQFVTRIYTDVLGRTADASGVDFWTAELDSGRRTRGTVMIGFSESLEYKGKQAANTDVSVAYIFLMGRAPTAAETLDWVTRQKAGTSQAVLATELLNSAGYAAVITG